MIKYILVILFGLYCNTGIGQSKASELIPTSHTLDSAAIIYNTYNVNLEVSDILISRGSITLFTSDSYVYKMFNVVRIYELSPIRKHFICQDGSNFAVKYLTDSNDPVSIMYYSPDRKTIIRYL